MTARFTDRMVRRALQLPGGVDIEYAAVVTDTRQLPRGALFVALSGPNFDGHAFLEAARDKGARGAVVRQGTERVPGLVLYQVADTLRALGDLAATDRERITGPVVAITGQNGKTSTKEMMAVALSTRWKTHRTRANLNNLVGVPLTILESPADAEAMVIEAGANLPGEIARYREIIRPDIAVVLNAGSGHLEGFGSVEGVMREKLSLARDVPVAIVGVQPPHLPDGARQLARRVITAGLEHADVVPDAVEMSPDGRAIVSKDGRTFMLATRGRHQAGNAMFVWAAARELGLDLDRVAAALELTPTVAGRGELVQHRALTVLNDCYNANPESFASAIAMAESLRAGRRLVFVAGSMRELGEHAPALHDRVAEQLARLQPELLALVGDFVPAFARHRGAYAGRLLEAASADDLAPLLAEHLAGDELLVLKASRGVALERILPVILARFASSV